MEAEVFLEYLQGHSYATILRHADRSFRSIDNALQRAKTKIDASRKSVVSSHFAASREARPAYDNLVPNGWKGSQAQRRIGARSMPSLPNLLIRIGGETAIRAAFSIEHPLVISETKVTMNGTQIIAEGRFLSVESNTEVGRFVRWIGEEARKGVIVKHQMIEVARDFRRRKIAWNHYKKAFAFYRSVGVSRVSLDANELGPYVWPSFNFNFNKREWGYMMRAWEQAWSLAGYAVPYWPSTAQELVYFLGPAGEQIGEQIISEVHAGLGGGLKMDIDFNDRETIRALVSVKLLEDIS